MRLLAGSELTHTVKHHSRQVLWDENQSYEAALLDGSAEFAPMSRPMIGEETAAFESKYGYHPLILEPE